MRIGVDIGGTFTDLVALDEATGAVVNTKALSTPRELLAGVLRCVDQAGVRLADCRLVIHGTTIGINALVERKGATTGLVTTEGFRDVLEIGRGNFLRMYDVLYRRPVPLVPRGRCREVPGRLTATGEVLVALDEEAVRAAARQLAADGVESVAIVFLFSYRDPSHEQRAAEIVARELPGAARLIAFDMGGTTAKCAIVERGHVQTTDEYQVDGHPIRIPVIDIKEVSAGGGTIAWIDPGGALALGPQSAGADPGPVCYARGGAEPTVTDANLVLGRIDAVRFLGGTMPLDLAGATRAIDEKVGAPLGLPRATAAAGVVRLADVKMALAVRSITTERGLDPRDYTLVAYGGGGPLHAVAIARELGIPRVVVPPSPSTFSAWGMLATDLRHDLVRTVIEPLERTDAAWAEARYGEMQREVQSILLADGVPVSHRAADLRYLGQEHTVTIVIENLGDWAELRQKFDAAHQRAYGYAAPDVEVQHLNLRLSVVFPLDHPPLPTLDRRPGGSPAFDTRKIYSTFVDDLLAYRV